MLGELKQFIYWTYVGREGALHFKELLRQKEMAEHLRESVAAGMSVEKTQKMIKRHVPVACTNVPLSCSLMPLCS